jgi:hypothetical protein
VRWLAIGFGVFVVVVIASAIWLTNYFGARDSIRWAFESKAYKSAVLAQPASPDGELKHVEWDDWGFAGQDTFVFVAFDPTDALSTAAKSKQRASSRVYPVKCTASAAWKTHWHVVHFYTETYWGQGECAGPSAKP